MKKVYQTILAGLIVASFALTGSAQTFNFEDTDESVAFRIKLDSGTTNTATLQTLLGGAGTNVFTIDGNANTVDGSGATDTIAELVAALNAATNVAGAKGYKIDSASSLAADSTDGELLTDTYTITEEWTEILYDTSACDFYQVYLPAEQSGSIATPHYVKQVYGEPEGTGDVTVAVYVDSTLKYQKTIARPEYIAGLVAATNTASERVNLEDEVPLVNIRVGYGESAIIRATRATDATDGNIGVLVD